VVRPLKTTFTKGELDPLLNTRADTVAYQHGAKLIQNMLPQPQGGLRMRPGAVAVQLLYNDAIDETANVTIDSAPNGGTAASLLDGNYDSVEFLTTTNLSTTSGYQVFTFSVTGHTVPEFWVVSLYQLRLNAANADIGFRIGYRTNPSGTYTYVELGFGDSEHTVELDEHSIAIEVPGEADEFVLELVTSTQDLTTTNVGVTQLELIGVDKHNSAAGGGTLADVQNNCPRIFPFKFSESEQYLLVFLHKCVFIVRNKTTVLLLPSRYTGAQLANVTVTAKDDTFLVFYEGIRPQALVRRGADDEWNWNNWTLNNIPVFDFGSGNEATWSDARGWPRCGSFFQGRLWAAGSTGRPSTIFASKSGDEQDFQEGTGDDFGIEVTANVSSNQKNPTFLTINIGPHLQFFADSAEFYIPKSVDTAITPGNVALRQATDFGSIGGMPVVNVAGATYFVERSRRVIREFVFSEVENNYVGNNASLLSQHLLIGVKDLTAFRPDSSGAASYIMVNSLMTQSDPVPVLPDPDALSTTVADDWSYGVAGFLTERQQEVAAWSRAMVSSVNAHVYAVAEADREFYQVILMRTTYGGPKYFNLLTVWDEDAFGDGGIIAPDLSGGTFPGLEHMVPKGVVSGLGNMQVGVDRRPRATPTTVDDLIDVTTGFIDLTGEISYSLNLATGDILSCHQLMAPPKVSLLPALQEDSRGSSHGVRSRIPSVVVDVGFMWEFIVSTAKVTNTYFVTNQIPDISLVGYNNEVVRKSGFRGWSRENFVNIEFVAVPGLQINGASYRVIYSEN